MRTLALLLFCLVLPLESWGEIYRWVDEQGSTVYSDVPKPGAKVVDLPPLPAFSPPAPGKPSETRQPAEQAAHPYTVLAIVKPAANETIHDSDTGTLQVEINLSPNLQTGHGHRIKVFLDGASLPQTYSSTGFSLPDIDRGPHSLQVEVVDQSGQALIASRPVAFHMWQGSLQLPPRYDTNPPLPKPSYPPIQPGPPLPLPPPPPPLPAPGYPPAPAPKAH